MAALVAGRGAPFDQIKSKALDLEQESELPRLKKLRAEFGIQSDKADHIESLIRARNAINH